MWFNVGPGHFVAVGSSAFRCLIFDINIPMCRLAAVLLFLLFLCSCFGSVCDPLRLRDGSLAVQWSQSTHLPFLPGFTWQIVAIFPKQPSFENWTFKGIGENVLNPFRLIPLNTGTIPNRNSSTAGFPLENRWSDLDFGKHLCCIHLHIRDTHREKRGNQAGHYKTPKPRSFPEARTRSVWMWKEKVTLIRLSNEEQQGGWGFWQRRPGQEQDATSSASRFLGDPERKKFVLSPVMEDTDEASLVPLFCV